MRQFDAVIVGAGFGGIGSTGVQLIPELANEVSELTVYQRTPIWVLPETRFRLHACGTTALRQGAARAASPLVVHRHLHGPDGRDRDLGNSGTSSPINRAAACRVIRPTADSAGLGTDERTLQRNFHRLGVTTDAWGWHRCSAGSRSSTRTTLDGRCVAEHTNWRPADISISQFDSVSAGGKHSTIGGCASRCS
jgi:cation diffusion facilitator CzcD-associated flavoprotein CzcO